LDTSKSSYIASEIKEIYGNVSSQLINLNQYYVTYNLVTHFTTAKDIVIYSCLKLLSNNTYAFTGISVQNFNSSFWTNSHATTHKTDIINSFITELGTYNFFISIGDTHTTIIEKFNAFIFDNTFNSLDAVSFYLRHENGNSGTGREDRFVVKNSHGTSLYYNFKKAYDLEDWFGQSGSSTIKNIGVSLTKDNEMRVYIKSNESIASLQSFLQAETSISTTHTLYPLNIARPNIYQNDIHDTLGSGANEITKPTSENVNLSRIYYETMQNDLRTHTESKYLRILMYNDISGVFRQVKIVIEKPVDVFETWCKIKLTTSNNRLILEGTNFPKEIQLDQRLSRSDSTNTSEMMLRITGWKSSLGSQITGYIVVRATYLPTSRTYEQFGTLQIHSDRLCYFDYIDSESDSMV
jgi:hypothetical protein